MTTYEHAMLGVTGALAAGLHRRYGWPIVALAGLTAALPDWDGLSILFGISAFDHVHRTVGHSLLVGTLVGAVVAAVDHRYRFILRVKEGIERRFAPGEHNSARAGPLWVWIVTGVVASWSHLGADLVFSGHPTLSDWGLRLLWPFSDRFWAYPMVSWGDPGPTLIFVGGMFAMIRWRRHVQIVAGSTLTLVLAYVSIRGWVLG